MGAVGADAPDDLGTAIEQQRNVAALDGCRDCFGAVDQRALIGLRQAQQNGRDIGGRQRRIDRACKGRRIVKSRRDKVKPGTLSVHCLGYTSHVLSDSHPSP
jgi:hypothetical protein